MEAKCGFCEFFGKKIHCHNCKMINQKQNRSPKEIECSLEEFISQINSGVDILENYCIGDKKTINLITGEKVTLVLLGVDADTLANGNGRARATFGILSIDGCFEMHPTDSNSWRTSKMRTVYMDRFFKLLPTVLQENIKLVIKKTSVGNRQSNIIETEEKLFLFSAEEVAGQNSYSYEGEGEQYEYFANSKNDFSSWTWSRSPYRDSSYNFCGLRQGGGLNYDCASDHYPVALGFCI